ncbi:uncharacterized protein TNCV_1385501 [Trichonephila clavipes]|nr:uncharacterized protein TNCV_1385501 [Trichonephila clavipes]
MQQSTSLATFVSVDKDEGIQPGVQRTSQLTITSAPRGAYLEYTQDIAPQHQGKDPTDINLIPLICSTCPTAMSLRETPTVPLKTRRVGQRCTRNLSRAETSSRWCGVVVRRGLRCPPRHLTMVQNDVVGRQKPSCS